MIATSRRKSRAGAAALACVLAGLLFPAPARAEERPAAARTAREVRIAERPAAAQRTRQVEFQPEKTDDWLCRHVSAFFCTSLFSTSSTSESATGSASRGTTVRSRG